MKQKPFHLLYLILFLVICLTPFAGMGILGPSEASANEILASPPKLTERDGSFNMGVLNDTEDYIADRFAFRRELVTAWAKLNAKLLHTSVQDQVVLGKEGYLFYASTEQDYMGICADDEQLTYAARNLLLMQEYVRSLGADFTFVIAPNKNSLYPAYMPDHYSTGETSNAKLLQAKLDALGVPYADLFAAFNNEDEPLYFRTDSHWNGKGAALAADAVLSALGRSSDYYGSSFTDAEPHKGDLYEMLYPAGTETEADFTPADGFTFRYDSEPNGGSAIKIETTGSGIGSLVCWRDSFGVSLHPYLAEAFGQSFFSRATVYDLTEAELRNADAVVIELVERNLSGLWENAPIVPAPIRSIDTVQARGAAVNGYTDDQTDTLVQVLVPADRTIADSGSPLYIRNGSDVFECCVIFDGESRLCSAYLPIDTDLTRLYLIGRSDGILTEFPITLA